MISNTSAVSAGTTISVEMMSPKKVLNSQEASLTDAEILAQPITRLTFLRLTAQSYNRMQDILGPLIISVKALASRSCELAGLKEMDLNLATRDEDFVKTARIFILNLRKGKVL